MPNIFKHPFDSDIWNAIVHTYLLSLGEFDFDDFGQRGTMSNTVLWATFIFGTFLLQITFMNMLIAIMGEVFNAVTERK